MEMHEIETARVRLRQFTLDDLPELARIFADPTVMKYLGRQGLPMTTEETQTTLLSIIRHWERHGFGRWGVVQRGEELLIGCAGLRSYEGIAELVYLIDQPFWGMGLATEIARACLRFGFEVQRFDNIIAFCRPQNTESRRVLEKIGMSFQGEVNIFDIDVVQYSLARDDFRSDKSVFSLHEPVETPPTRDSL